MAVDFNRLSEQTQELIEKGRLAKIEVNARENDLNRAMVAYQSAQARLSTEKSKTDEEGNPVGDVQEAQNEVNYMASRLSAAQDAYFIASAHAEHVQNEQQRLVGDLEGYQMATSNNIGLLRQLESLEFAENANPALDGMTSKYNLAEQNRVALLREMGIDASVALLESASMNSMASGWSVIHPESLGTYSNLSGRYSGPTAGSFETGRGDRGRLGLDPNYSTYQLGLSGSSPAGSDRSGEQNDTPTGFSRGRKRSRSGSETIFDGQSKEERDLNDIMEFLSSDSVSRDEKLEWVRNNWNTAGNRSGIQNSSNASLQQLTFEDRYEASLERIERTVDAFSSSLDAQGYTDCREKRQALQMKREELQDILVNDLLNDTDLLSSTNIGEKQVTELISQIEQLSKDKDGIHLFSSAKISKFQNQILSGEAGLDDVLERGRQASEKMNKLNEKRDEKIRQLKAEKKDLTERALLNGRFTPEEEAKVNEMDQKISVLNNGASSMKKMVGQFRSTGLRKDPDCTIENPAVSKANTAHHLRKLEAIMEVLPTDWAEAINGFTVSVFGLDRAYSDTDIMMKKAVFNLGGMDYDSSIVAIHEYCHFIEAKYPAINKTLNDFFEKRTNGQPLVPLKTIDPGYGSDEFYRPGQPPFLHQYMGKVYPGVPGKREHFELLSMGVESLYRDPHSLDGDPEYRNLILGILTSL